MCGACRRRAAAWRVSGLRDSRCDPPLPVCARPAGTCTGGDRAAGNLHRVRTERTVLLLREPEPFVRYCPFFLMTSDRKHDASDCSARGLRFDQLRPRLAVINHQGAWPADRHAHRCILMRSGLFTVGSHAGAEVPSHTEAKTSERHEAASRPSDNKSRAKLSV